MSFRVKTGVQFTYEVDLDVFPGALLFSVSRSMIFSNHKDPCLDHFNNRPNLVQKLLVERADHGVDMKYSERKHA